jgi:peptidoglycan/LPS O-acetylase OafA/YrhL
MNQVEGLQVWRAIAVLLVASLHVIQMVYLQPKSAINLLRFCNLGMFGVDIFFVISGFILGMTALRAATGEPRVQAYDFIARRVMRIFPTYWIIILFPLFRLVRHHELTGFKLFRYWFLLPGLSYPVASPIVGIAWTLIFEMIFYYALAIFMRFALRHAVANTMVALVAMVSIGLIVGNKRPVLVFLASPILLEFVLGGITALAYQRFRSRRGAGIGLLIGGLIATGLLTNYVTNNMAIEQNVLSGNGILLHAFTWGLAAWLLVSGVIFWGPQVKSQIGRLFVAIGNQSYSIYLTSAISVEMVFRVMKKMPSAIVPHGYLAVLEGIACVVLIGIIFYWLVERPLGKKLGQLYNSYFKTKPERLNPHSVGA